MNRVIAVILAAAVVAFAAIFFSRTPDTPANVEEPSAINGDASESTIKDISGGSTIPEDAKAGDTGESATVARVRVVSANLDEPLDQLLTRESIGDAEAIYELLMRAIECIKGLRKDRCNEAALDASLALGRLRRAADLGHTPAQVSYLTDGRMLLGSEDLNDTEIAAEVERSFKYLHDAKSSGSVEALAWLGMQGTADVGGSERRDVDESVTNISRIDAVAYLHAANKVYEALGKNPHMKSIVEEQLLKLNPVEYEQALALSRETLSRAECCFTVYREVN